jgi:hypothetical protein
MNANLSIGVSELALLAIAIILFWAKLDGWG